MSANITSQLIVQGSITSASPACSCISQNQTVSGCGLYQMCKSCDILLVLLISSLVATAILLVFTTGMAMYIYKTRRSNRLPLTSVKAVGIRLPAFDQRTSGGLGDDTRRQQNGVKKPVSAEEVSPPPAAVTYRVDLHCGGYADSVTVHNEKQWACNEQLRGRGREPTEGADGLTLPAAAASAVRGVSASPAATRRAADSQFGDFASPASLRPSAICLQAHAVPGATVRAASPVRGLAPPPSPLPVPVSPATSRANSPVRGLAPPPSPLPVPSSPAVASKLRPVAGAAGTLERTLQPCAAIFTRGAGDGDGGNVGEGLKRSDDSSSSSSNSISSSAGGRSAGLVRSYMDAIGAKALELGGSRSNVACGSASATTAQQASRSVPAAASTAYTKAVPHAASPIRRKSSRFRAAAGVRRLSDSQLDQCRGDFRLSDARDVDDTYIAVLPSPPPQQLSSEFCHDGDDYENAGPVNVALFEHKQPRQPEYQNGQAAAAGGGQQRTPLPATRRQRRRSLESGIEDYDYCNETVFPFMCHS